MKRQIRLNAALLKGGLVEVADGKVVRAQAYAVPEGGSALLYITAPDNSGAILDRARQALAGIEGVDAVVEPKDYPAYRLPLPSANSQMSALFLTAKEGYAFADGTGPDIVTDAREGSLGAHGYVATDPDLQSLFIASGRGIAPGVTLETVENIDVAPTAARLLGFEMPNVEGKVLTRILR